MEQRATFYVYLYLRKTASEYWPAKSPYYVGKGTGRRAWLRRPREVSPPSDRSLIIIVKTGLTSDVALALESQLINEYGRIDLGTGSLRNKTNGGEGLSGLIRTESHRLAIGESSRARWADPKYREKMSAAMNGRCGKFVRSPALRKKLSDILKGRKLGAPISPEARLRLSVSRKGRPTWNKGKRTKI